jgi:hypothetical protein
MEGCNDFSGKSLKSTDCWELLLKKNPDYVILSEKNMILIQKGIKKNLVKALNTIENHIVTGF